MGCQKLRPIILFAVVALAGYTFGLSIEVLADGEESKLMTFLKSDNQRTFATLGPVATEYQQDGFFNQDNDNDFYDLSDSFSFPIFTAFMTGTGGDEKSICKPEHLLDFTKPSPNGLTLTHGATHAEVVAYLADSGITYSVNSKLDISSIFNTNFNGPTADRDLEDPQPDIPEIKNVLIIQEHGQPSRPDDDARGGTHTMVFTNPVTLKEVRVIDIEGNEEMSFFVGHIDGGGMVDENMLITGNNRQRLMNDELSDFVNIKQLDITLEGSGAFTNLCLEPMERKPGIEHANVSIDIKKELIEINGKKQFQNLVNQCIFHSPDRFEPLCLKCQFLDDKGTVIAQGHHIELDKSYEPSTQIPIEMSSVPEVQPGAPAFNEIQNVDGIRFETCEEKPPECRDLVTIFTELDHGTRQDLPVNPPPTSINAFFAPDGITVSGFKPDGITPTEVIIFDGSQSNTPDPDLEVGLKLLILPEEGTLVDADNDGFIDNPNDAAAGGTIIIRSQFERFVVSFDFVDHDNDKLAEARFYDSEFGGTLLKTVQIPNAGNKSVQTINVNVGGVKRIEIDYRDSGGVTNLNLLCKSPCVPCEKPTIFTVLYEGPKDDVKVKIFKDIDKKTGLPKNLVFTIPGTFDSGENITFDSNDFGQKKVNSNTVYAFYDKWGKFIGAIKIHTSCSKLLFIDQMFFFEKGTVKQIKLTVVSGIDFKGNPSIPLEQCVDVPPDDPPKETCDCQKPDIFTVMYNGPDGAQVTVSKKGSAPVFLGTFNDGEPIVVNAVIDLGRSTLESDTTYSFGGTASGKITIHTSCSQFPPTPHIGQIFTDGNVILTVVSGSRNGVPSIPGPECVDNGDNGNGDDNGGQCVVDRQISMKTDDAEQRRSSGNMELNSSDLDLADRQIGLRFKNIDIPQGTTITKAWIQFTAEDDNEKNSAHVDIFAEDENNANTFSNSNSDITNRDMTSNSVNWEIPKWSNDGDSGQAQRTPDLSSIVQEVVNRGGWASGNSMAFMLKVDNSGDRDATTFDKKPSDAAILHIECSDKNGNDDWDYNGDYNGDENSEYSGEILKTNFNSNTEGFSYIDDAFRGTSAPKYADGKRLGSGGFSGGGLQVILGGQDKVDIFGMSGGWKRTFTLDDSTDVFLSFYYKLIQNANYEKDEFSQVLVSVDGKLFGQPPDDYVDYIVGNGNGGTKQHTGWQLFEANLGKLSEGEHTIVIGGYNNKKTYNDESTTIIIDDVSIQD